MLALHTETEMPQTNHQLNAKNSECCCYFVATQLTAKKQEKKSKKTEKTNIVADTKGTKSTIARHKEKQMNFFLLFSVRLNL